MFCTAGDRLAKAYPYRMAIDIPGVNSQRWPNMELAISRYSPLLSVRPSTRRNLRVAGPPRVALSPRRIPIPSKFSYSLPVSSCSLDSLCITIFFSSGLKGLVMVNYPKRP